MANERGTDPEKFLIEERRAKVYDLRLSHKSIRKIAKTLGVSVGTVHKDLVAVLDRLKSEADETAEHHRSLDVQRLDEAADALWTRVELGELDALDRYLKLQERRSKLLGLNAPEKLEHRHELAGSSEQEINQQAIDELVRDDETRELVRAALAKWDSEQTT